MLKRVGLAACSNGHFPERKGEIDELARVLLAMGIHSVETAHLYARDGVFGGSARERAADLMAFYGDGELDAIFDISGGDIANEVLDFLDYDTIGRSDKEFWGYSDLTTVINAIYAKTGRASVLYQIRNLVGERAELQQRRFLDFRNGNGADLFAVSCRFLQGNAMSDIVVGGNIRCLLKLAGTPYWPEMRGKILLLEALGGGEAQLAAYAAQLSQLGVFRAISGVLLGTFSKFEETEKKRTVFDMLSPYIEPGLPLAKTEDIGHGADARAIRIGEFARFAAADGGISIN